MRKRFRIGGNFCLIAHSGSPGVVNRPRFAPSLLLKSGHCYCDEEVVEAVGDEDEVGGGVGEPAVPILNTCWKTLLSRMWMNISVSKPIMKNQPAFKCDADGMGGFTGAVLLTST